MITEAKTHLRRLLPKNAFARGVSVLVGGTAGAQLLTMLVAPLLTRLYGPEDFGLVAVYGSLLALIGVISSLRYELAIPLPEDNGEAANVAALSLILVGVSTLLAGILVLLLDQPIADALGVPQLAGYLWLLPVGVLLGGGYSTFNYWSVRTKRFSTIAATKICQSLASIAIQLAAFKLGGLGLLLAQVAGQSVGTTSLARPALASTGFKQVSWGGIWRAAGRYRRFPIFSTPAGLSRTAGVELPPLVFAALFSPSAAGLYALANRVLHIPMSLIGGAISQVFLANAAEDHRSGRLGTLVDQLHSKLAHIGLPPAFLLFLLGPDLFAFVFGENWRQSGEFARWMAPWIYLVFVSSPLTMLTTVLERQQEGLIFHLILLVLRVVSIFIGAWIGDLTTAVIIFAAVNGVWRLIFLFWLVRISGNTVRSTIATTAWAAGVALLCAIPVIAAMGFSGSFADLWLYALVVSAILIVGRYLQLLSFAY